MIVVGGFNNCIRSDVLDKVLLWAIDWLTSVEVVDDNVHSPSLLRASWKKAHGVV